ncbi:type VII secretion system-associated protein [Actinokineospora inagensis]|uniref:type VII secretion system-associated protein n=1 Tax=Actinokineospora inagensis TaxID=103730 RepID=UPI000422D998|nr:type VII secretion system-associated protein [Actinokineospora inagensis]
MSTPRRPPITAALRAQARTAPDSWLPVVADDGQVAGRYLVDGRGEITDEFVPNPHYRPRWSPSITPEMRSYALSRPGGWVEVLDPAHEGSNVPEWAVVGRYPVDAGGGVIPAFDPNPGYRPSPAALGWPAPRSEAEAVLQLAHTGQIEYREAVIAVLAATLVLPADPNRPPRTRLELRGRVAHAFVTEDAVPPDWPPHWQKFSGVEVAILIGRLADQFGGPPDLLIHAEPDLQVRIPGTVMLEALRLVSG